MFSSADTLPASLFLSFFLFVLDRFAQDFPCGKVEACLSSESDIRCQSGCRIMPGRRHGRLVEFGTSRYFGWWDLCCQRRPKLLRAVVNRLKKQLLWANARKIWGGVRSVRKHASTFSHAFSRTCNQNLVISLVLLPVFIDFICISMIMSIRHSENPIKSILTAKKAKWLGKTENSIKKLLLYGFPMSKGISKQFHDDIHQYFVFVERGFQKSDQNDPRSHIQWSKNGLIESMTTGILTILDAWINWKIP